LRASCPCGSNARESQEQTAGDDNQTFHLPELKPCPMDNAFSRVCDSNPCHGEKLLQGHTVVVSGACDHDALLRFLIWAQKWNSRKQ
jgi:hypothetical protein